MERSKKDEWGRIKVWMCSRKMKLMCTTVFRAFTDGWLANYSFIPSRQQIWKLLRWTPNRLMTSLSSIFGCSSSLRQSTVALWKVCFEMFLSTFIDILYLLLIEIIESNVHLGLITCLIDLTKQFLCRLEYSAQSS